MSLDLPNPATLPFEQFWNWLQRHRNCILRVGAGDSYVYDLEQFHWQFSEDDDRNGIVQLAFGKLVIAEIIVDPHGVLCVQTTPDPGDDEPERTLFEVITGAGDDGGVRCHFLLTHAFDETVPHARTMKH